MLEPKKVLLHKVAMITLMHDKVTDHLKLNIDTPVPVTTFEQKKEIARLMRKAADQLEDRIAWEHVTEIVATAQGKKVES